MEIEKTDSTTVKTIAEPYLLASVNFYRTAIDIKQIYNDIRQTALNISTRGFIDKEKFSLLQKGIVNIKPFIYMDAYRIEDAIVDASKAAYLATLIESGGNDIERFNYAQLADDLQINPVLTSKLNKLRIGLPEAYFYWAKTSGLIK